MRFYRELYRYIVLFWKELCFVLLFGFLVAILGTIEPYLLKIVVDGGFVGGNVSIFFTTMVIGGAIFITRSVIGRYSERLSRLVKVRVGVMFRRQILERLYGRPYYIFRKSSTGEYLYLINTTVEQVLWLIVDAPIQALLLMLRISLILAVLFWLNWQMALVGLLLMPLSYAVPHRLFSRINEMRKELARYGGQSLARLEKAFSHILLVKTFGKERAHVRIHVKDIINCTRLNIKLEDAETATMLAHNVTSGCMVAAVIAIGGYYVMQDRLSLGGLGAIGIYLRQ